MKKQSFHAQQRMTIRHARARKAGQRRHMQRVVCKQRLKRVASEYYFQLRNGTQHHFTPNERRVRPIDRRSIPSFRQHIITTMSGMLLYDQRD